MKNSRRISLEIQTENVSMLSQIKKPFLTDVKDFEMMSLDYTHFTHFPAIQVSHLNKSSELLGVKQTIHQIQIAQTLILKEKEERG